MRSPSTGFTLVELLITSLVLVILLGVGLPSFSTLIRNQRVKSASFELYSTLVLARSEAITRNMTVTIAPTGGTWASGWSVTDAGGNVLRTQDGLGGLSIAGPASIEYRGSGRLRGATLPEFQLSATGDSAMTRCIRVDLSGRPYTKAEPC